ncbi:MAG TPA: Smr/MutS family protein, partial [Pyrinomonadaceae bacterium]
PESARGAEEFRPSPEAREVAKGDTVRLRTFGKVGKVERVSGGEAEVLVGRVRLREKLSNLELVERVAPKAAAARGGQLERMAAASRATTQVRLAQAKAAPDAELNLIGRTTDEAADETDKFLDEAFIHGLARVRIIHGHGTGALRRAVAQLLQGHPHVASFAPAPPDQGGAGATVVELK